MIYANSTGNEAKIKKDEIANNEEGQINNEEERKQHQIRTGKELRKEKGQQMITVNQETRRL